jgi:hypothetical protein
LLAVSCIVFVQRIHGIWFEGSEACRAVDLALCRSYFMRTSSLSILGVAGPEAAGCLDVLLSILAGIWPPLRIVGAGPLKCVRIGICSVEPTSRITNWSAFTPV